MCSYNYIYGAGNQNSKKYSHLRKFDIFCVNILQNLSEICIKCAIMEQTGENMQLVLGGGGGGAGGDALTVQLH